MNTDVLYFGLILGAIVVLRADVPSTAVES